MKLKLTKNEIITVSNVITNLVNSSEKYPMAFSYFLSRNKRLLTDEVKDINNTVSEKLKACREELVESKIIGDKGIITDVEKFRSIEEKYKVERAEVEKFLAEETDIELYEIKLKMIPEHISANYFDALYPLVIEPTEEELE